MDYTTSYIFFLVSLGLFTVVLLSLALVDRSVIGARLLACATFTDLLKTTLQGIHSHTPRFISVCVANELNILAFFLMFLGLRWFVVRKPLQSWLGPILIGVAMLAYLGMFLEKMRVWSFSVASAPVLAMCSILVWIMARQKDERFVIPARLTATFLAIHVTALAYRCWLSLRGIPALSSGPSPWADPRWMYSMLVIMLIAYCLLLMYVLFTVMEMHSSVAHAAGVDALTGALNRRALMKHAARELVRSERLATPLAIVVVDLDNFKRVNDTHGHGGGDVALCAFVDLVKEHLRAEDAIARIGGEEFVLMLPGTDTVTAAQIAERLRSGLEQMRVHYEGKMIVTTMSAGVTERQPGDPLTTVLKRGDSLLYQAKASGRNCIVVDERTVQYPKPVLVERFGPQRHLAGKKPTVSAG
jgi:diguanylate cyclase (GGDEF)-like protein